MAPGDPTLSPILPPAHRSRGPADSSARRAIAFSMLGLLNFGKAHYHQVGKAVKWAT